MLLSNTLSVWQIVLACLAVSFRVDAILRGERERRERKRDREIEKREREGGGRKKGRREKDGERKRRSDQREISERC